MDHDAFEGAACAASDLTARFLLDLALAQRRLALAEARFRAAAASVLPIPALVREERLACRRQISMLRHVLAGMPSIEGGCHAESA